MLNPECSASHPAFSTVIQQFPMSYFSHLECSVPCGAGPYDPRREQHLCTCGAPLLARYDLKAARAWRRESLAAREPTMWRYREVMPLFDGETPVSLGEGWTPLFHAARAPSQARHCAVSAC